jgi:NAD(P)-dependent dehydrogenase (short-subunit alcohol dehydrogenase family)
LFRIQSRFRFRAEFVLKSIDLFNLRGKSALVTGGGRGIGRTIAIALADAGADVVVASRNLENCAAVADEISKSTGRKAYPEKLDVTEIQSISQVVKAAAEKLGGIDILVNNSGSTWGAPFEEMPLEKWDQVIRTNLTGTFLISQQVVPLMKQQSWGRIINVSSIVALVSPPEFMNTVGYTASKGGIVALTRELAVKLAMDGIVVNAIAPSFFPSKMTSAFVQKFGDKIRNSNPMNRLGTDDDLKGVVVFLASQAASYVTGQVIAIDGGYTAI